MKKSKIPAFCRDTSGFGIFLLAVTTQKTSTKWVLSKVGTYNQPSHVTLRPGRGDDSACARIPVGCVAGDVAMCYPKMGALKQCVIPSKPQLH